MHFMEEEVARFKDSQMGLVALGEVSIKLSIANRSISYKGDVFGQQRATVRQQQAAMFTESFPNGDGLLAAH